MPAKTSKLEADVVEDIERVEGVEPTTTKVKKPLIFAIIGVFNTGLDFALMYIFQLFIPLVVANICSTGISMISSFVLNKKYTFHSTGKNYVREVIMFFIFTAIGLWGIQSGCIWLIEHLIPETTFGGFAWAYPIFAKGLASIPSLTWNYLTYNRFVFTNKN